ncbi:MAG: beta strand repeat-containing protein, partial [Cypionkella sp.]
MAHDGGFRLGEFSPFSGALGEDLSVGGKLSLSSFDHQKPLSGTALLGSTDILAADRGTSSDGGSLWSTDSIYGAGHVDAVALNLDLAPGLTNLDSSGNSAIDFGPPGAPASSGSLQTLANYLESGWWASRGASARSFDMSSGDNNGTLYYNVTGWSGSKSTFYGAESDTDGISAARQVLVREAFNIYGEVLGINFVETTNSTSTLVDFFFKDSSSGAYSAEQLYSGSGGTMDYAVINVASNWYSTISDIGGVNAYTFQTILHEIGHALGLGHQGPYNGAASYANDSLWANDSWQQSMMSYISQTENTEYSTDSYAQLVSPMAVDWLAFEAIYGSQGYGISNAFTGNTIYGVGTNITTSAAFANLATYAATNAFTIVDGSGIDTVDFSTYSANQLIDLWEYTASSTHAGLSSVGGLSKNMTIAIGTVIENATTGDGNDTIYGNSANNNLTGNAGNDYLSSYDGDDTLYGGDGNDTLYGGDGNDYVYGGNGSDYISAGAGNDYIIAYNSSAYDTSDTVYGGSGDDSIYAGYGGAATLDGGSGTDQIYLAYNGANYSFNMAAGTTNQTGEVYSGFEIAYMGSGNDVVYAAAVDSTIFGGSGNDVLVGGAGNDSIDGGAGNDSLYGGTGDDTIVGADGNDYIVDSFGNDSLGGGAGTDTIYGGDGNDTIFGYDGAFINNGDLEYGGNGNDQMWSGDGAVTMDGGAGIDTAHLYITGKNYNFNMSTGVTNQTGEVYTNFEVANLGVGNDTVYGTANADTIYGGGGNDYLYSGAGDDYVMGGDGNDYFGSADGADTIYGGAGNDTIYAHDSSGYATGDVVDGGAGDDYISTGYGGAVTLDGSTGVDTIYLGYASVDYTFNMATGATNQTGEVYTGFEIAYMGSGNENVTGTAGDDRIYGGSGNDSVYGGTGDDYIYGGAGNDYLYSSTGADTIYGGDGNDTIYAYNPAGYNTGETVNAGAGNDYVSAGYGGAATLEGSTGVDTIALGIASADYTFNMTTGVTNQTGEVYTGFEIAQMGSGNDYVVGTDGDNTIYGGSGNETVYGSDGDDYMTGDSGNDQLYGGAGTDTIYGGDGNDTILNTGAANAVNGDVAYGGAGNDFMAAGIGAETMDGGTGIDTIDLSLSSANRTFSMNTGATNQSGESYLNFERVNMGGGNDTVTGTASEDSIYGGAGNDYVYAGAGNDYLTGGDGNDWIAGDDGTDTIYGGAGDDVLFAYGSTSVGTGDSISGGDGNDSLYVGFGGAATMDGGAGNDLIYLADNSAGYTLDMSTGVTNQTGETYTNF